MKTKIGLDAYLTDNRGIVLFDSGDSKNIGKDFLKWLDVKKLSGANTALVQPVQMKTTPIPR
jgi:hypothetical protein